MILSDFAKAIGQMTDRRFLRVLLLGLGLTVLLLIAVTAGFVWLVEWLVPDSVALPFGLSLGHLDAVASIASVLAVLGLSVFLMVPVAAAFTGIFLDDVAEAVEARHYPWLAPVAGTPFVVTLRDALGFLCVVIAVNLVALILYFFVGPFAPILFWVVNGYLLGREYFQLVALRRVGPAGARAARRRHAGQIWLAGVLMVAPLSVPILNLFVPILGAATFTHLYHRLESGTPRRG